MSPRRYLLVTSLLLIAIFAAVTLLANKALTGARLDMTENKLFTLAEGTKTVTGNLSDPLDLTFVYTRSVGQEFPAVRAYAVRVQELLDAYVASSNGKLRLRVIDPAPFSEAEDEALAAGLVAVDTNGSDPLYFGLIGRNSVDDERVIPFLAPEQETRLEYDLTRLIARLDRSAPTRIGLISTLPGMTAVTDEAGYTVLREMNKTFDVETLPDDFLSIPDDIDVLFLAHAPDLSDWQMWQIDQFLLRKGRALMLVDPATKTAPGDGPFGMTNRRIRSDLGVFSTSFGVALDRPAIADTQTALAIEAPAGEGRTTILQHPLFLSIPPALMSRENVLTSDLRRAVNLGATGRFILPSTETLNREILIESGPTPSIIDPAQAAIDMPPDAVIAAYEAGREPAALALNLTGPLTTAFPSGRPPVDLADDPILADLARGAENEAADHLSTSDIDAQIILVADADLLDDGLYMNLQTGLPFADNASFILNALDSLSGGSDLMSLRARSPGLRPMRRVENMRNAAQAEFFTEQARLEGRLAESEQRLQELQSISANDGFFDGDVSAQLNDQEREELARLREDIVATRASLRQIERDFRREIDALELNLRIFTILGGPALLGLIGLFLWWRRRGGAA
ncbi:MAG: Gldg family protein [Pseudomonadota bacterium]